jgi:hypothetical protein
MILTHGILPARHRTSFTEPELLEPDAMYEIRCGPRRVFLPGHRASDQREASGGLIALIVA